MCIYDRSNTQHRVGRSEHVHPYVYERRALLARQPGGIHAGRGQHSTVCSLGDWFTKLDDPTGSVRNDNSFTFVDDVTLVRGRNMIKTGVTVHRIQENKASPSVADEIYTFTSLTNFTIQCDGFG